MKQQKICRSLTYQAQQEIATGFLRIKNLNPQAKRLRTQKRNAIRRLSRAPTPHVAAVIAAEIAIIKTQQIALRAKQKAIILTSKSKAQSHLLKIPGGNKVTPPPLSLVERPKLSMSPSYYNPINLSSKQEIIISWNLQTNFNFKNKNFISMEGKCGSHIKPKGYAYQIKYSYPDTY